MGGIFIGFLVSLNSTRLQVSAVGVIRPELSNFLQKKNRIVQHPESPEEILADIEK